MTSKRAWLIAPLALVLLALAWLPSQAVTSKPVNITIGAASSLTDVMPRIGAAFTRQYPSTSVRFSFAGSPQLVEQVLAGAPIDVLVTASDATMHKAVQESAVSHPVAIARNSMAIAVPAGNPARIHSLGDLVRDRVSVATCAATVPCGAATTSLLARNGLSLTPVTQEADVRSVLGKVIADEVDAAIVYVTDARAAGSKVTAVAIPAALNVSTSYPIATVTDSTHSAQASAFVRFVRESPVARQLLADAGFMRP